MVADEGGWLRTYRRVYCSSTGLAAAQASRPFVGVAAGRTRSAYADGPPDSYVSTSYSKFRMTAVRGGAVNMVSAPGRHRGDVLITGRFPLLCRVVPIGEGEPASESGLG